MLHNHNENRVREKWHHAYLHGNAQTLAFTWTDIGVGQVC